jgi:DNA modification methylase
MLSTAHSFITGDSRKADFPPPGSVDLVVTSPPYPMISMWDRMFGKLNPAIRAALKGADGGTAFELMHRELDRAWAACAAAMKDGAVACVNIGDAVRTIGGRFRMYPNHARVIAAFTSLGLDTLPAILWRKQTNAPNKFMGSGMLPPSAYVTLEHEFILVFRKNAKRVFPSTADRDRRCSSAFFWEERNQWFSDIWFDLKGTKQATRRSGLRDRSAAYPFELAYRLINMYSVAHDTVYDPFAGTGTTMLAAIASCRSSVCMDIDAAFAAFSLRRAAATADDCNARVGSRLAAHERFTKEYAARKGRMKYTNAAYGFRVMTGQETDLVFPTVHSIRKTGPTTLTAEYKELK